ncbi:31908_t:CDS:1, partial [Racocetra persica]
PFIQQNLNNQSIDLKNIKALKNISKDFENISNVEDAENITTFEIDELKDTTNINDLEDITNVNNLDHGEKFLTYLPHSGFSNQLTSLKNAIILSYITNRTLIIPPILFAKIPHKGKKLYKTLNESATIKKARLLCSTNHTIFCSDEYNRYDSFSLMNWSNLFDFTFVRKHIRVINRGYDFNLQTLEKFLNITTKDTYYFVEEIRYEFQYFDTDDTNIEAGYHYQKKYFISNLKSRPETLIHLGSTFGLDRLVLEQRQNVDLYYGLLANFKFGHMALEECVKKIVEELGRRKSFIGIHIRVGDGGFKSIQFKEQLIDSMFNRLVSETKEWLEKPYSDSKEYPNVMKDNYYLLNSSKTLLNSKCLESKKSPVIYIASDSKNPKQNFKKIYSNFNPCVFTLSDFKRYLEPLRDLYNDFDNHSLYSLFMPFVDMLVVSNGGIFIGTLNSSFSRVARDIHDFQQF